MISRTWHGAVPMKHEQGFYEYELFTGVEETRNTEGNLNESGTKLKSSFASDSISE